MKTHIRRTSITLWTMIVGMLILPLFALAGVQQDARSLTSPTGSSPSTFAFKAMQTSAKMASLHVDMAEEYTQEAKHHSKKLHKIKQDTTIDIKYAHKHTNKTHEYKLKADWHEKQAKKWTV